MICRVYVACAFESVFKGRVHGKQICPCFFLSQLLPTSSVSTFPALILPLPPYHLSILPLLLSLLSPSPSSLPLPPLSLSLLTTPQSYPFSLLSSHPWLLPPLLPLSLPSTYNYMHLFLPLLLGGCGQLLFICFVALS